MNPNIYHPTRFHGEAKSVGVSVRGISGYLESHRLAKEARETPSAKPDTIAELRAVADNHPDQVEINGWSIIPLSRRHLSTTNDGYVSLFDTVNYVGANRAGTHIYDHRQIQVNPSNDSRVAVYRIAHGSDSSEPFSAQIHVFPETDAQIILNQLALEVEPAV